MHNSPDLSKLLKKKIIPAHFFRKITKKKNYLFFRTWALALEEGLKRVKIKPQKSGAWDFFCRREWGNDPDLHMSTGFFRVNQPFMKRLGNPNKPCAAEMAPITIYKFHCIDFPNYTPWKRRAVFEFLREAPSLPSKKVQMRILPNQLEYSGAKMLVSWMVSHVATKIHQILTWKKWSIARHRRVIRRNFVSPAFLDDFMASTSNLLVELDSIQYMYRSLNNQGFGHRGQGAFIPGCQVASLFWGTNVIHPELIYFDLPIQ